jgi:Zn-dependent M28 family amino/carboxypeptidase
MFLFIGGEENGLLGTKQYSSHPVFPPEKTITFINLDMVGNGTGLSVSASSHYKNFLTYFESANTKYIHRTFRGSAPEAGAYFGRPRSDSYNFSSVGIRTMSIGTTDGYKKVFYHLPGDDPDAITIDIMEDVAKMIYVALTNMANDGSLK